MKFAAMLIGAAVMMAFAQVAKQPASFGSAVIPAVRGHIAPQTFTELEKRFDSRLTSIGGANDPVDLLGTTRGIYLEGYGAVFTTEASFIITPTVNPFRQTISKELAAQVHQRKTARVPLLRQAMQDMMKTAAATLLQIPENQQVVVAVRFLYLPWEDTTGLPAQIIMKADRKSAMAGNIQTEEQ